MKKIITTLLVASLFALSACSPAVVGPTEDEILNSITLATQYLKNNVNKDGTFNYFFNPETGEVDDSYNILRHAGTAYSMFEAYEVTQDKELLAKGLKTLEYLNSQIKDCEEDKCLVEDNSIKLGGNGLAIIAFLEYQEKSGDTKYLETAKALGNWIISIQDENGQFKAHKITYDTGRATGFSSDYYPGEAILGLIRLYETTKDTKYLKAAEKSAEWLINVRDYGKDIDELEADHWLLYALSEIYLQSPKKLYKKHIFKIVDAILSEQITKDKNPDWIGGYNPPPRSTPTATRTEGLLAVYKVFPKEKILRAIELGLNFQLRTQVKEGPGLGGFGASLTSSKIRIDYVQHNLSGLVEYYKVLTKTR